MIRTQVSLPESEYQRAKSQAKQRHMSLAAFLRLALRSAMPPATDKPWMAFAGMVSSGNPRSSQQIDEVVYQKD